MTAPALGGSLDGRYVTVGDECNAIKYESVGLHPPRPGRQFGDLGPVVEKYRAEYPGTSAARWRFVSATPIQE